MTANSITSAQVGNTELQVTRLGMGTAPIGNLYSNIDDAEAIETVQRSFENGIRFFDTAPLYGTGEAERRLGEALRGIPRDEVIIQIQSRPHCASRSIDLFRLQSGWRSEELRGQPRAIGDGPR